MNKIISRRASALLLVLALTLGLNAQPGSIDLGISFGDGANNTVQAIALQSDGKILIGGDFTSYNGTDRNRIARLNADGSLDTGFNPGTGANDNIWAVALQPDGKILIGGYFTNYNGTGRSRIARLNADGSLDTDFNPGTGANGTVFSIALQPDGKILIGGQFLTYNGTGRRRIARLNADGSLDTGFNPGVGASNSVYSVALQPDGKILIGGGFTFYNGTSRSTIARLNADGSLDTSFDPGTGAFGSVWAVTLQPDGKILIGGDFSSFNGTARKFVARLNADGSVDLGFDPGTGANHLVLSIAVQLDGKVLIGGIYTSYNGTTRRRIARLNANGSLDTGFDPGTGTNNTVYSVALQPDGNILIGGDFTNYNGTSRKRVALVIGGEATCLDADNDGYEDAVCGGEDCDDTNNALNPNTVWYLDADNDGYYIGAGVTQCASPGTGYRYTGILGGGDCNDNNAAINPAAIEVCDNKDNDCNDTIDDVTNTAYANWQSADVGGSNGSASYPPCFQEPDDEFTINATGFSTASSDKLNAIYQELCGNGEIVAQVLNVSGGGWAGIMLRENLDPGSRKVALKMQGNNNIRREIRTITNGTVSSLNYFRPQHTWLRLVRNGGTFVGYTSIDGINWSYSFSTTITMNGCIYAGLFSESINNSVTTTATFDNVTITKPEQTLGAAVGTPFVASGNSLKPEWEVEIFPNPTDGNLNVDLSAYTNKVTRLEVYDNLGKVLKILETETMNVQLDLSAYQSGLYLIRVKPEGLPDVTKRVVLQQN